ncbi:TIGR02186 family protein [Thermosulfuriphilus sp.]
MKDKIIILILAILLASVAEARAVVSCEVEPSYVPITFFYNGTNIKLYGHADQKVEFVVLIQDEPHRVTLRRKGKVKGVFWMNVGEITYDPVPRVYMVFSSKPVSELIEATDRAKYGIGYEALSDKVRIEPDPGPERDRWFREFVKFKEKNRLYREDIQSIKIESDSLTSGYNLMVRWPYQAPPGTYTVRVFSVKDGKVIDYCQKEIKVQKVGLLKAISDLAFEKAPIYGIIAIVVAVIAGIGVGVIFGGKGGAH